MTRTYIRHYNPQCCETIFHQYPKCLHYPYITLYHSAVTPYSLHFITPGDLYSIFCLCRFNYSGNLSGIIPLLSDNDDA